MKRILDTHFASSVEDEYNVDLSKFAEFFVAAHNPIEKHFLFLCQSCHNKYDRGEIAPGTSEVIVPIVINKKTPITPKIPLDGPLYKRSDENIQDYVKRLLSALYEKGKLSPELLSCMQNKDYCKDAFGIAYPLLEPNSQKINIGGHNRYWTNYKFADKYYVCSQWWKQDFALYEYKLHKWVEAL